MKRKIETGKRSLVVPQKCVVVFNEKREIDRKRRGLKGGKG